HLKAARFPAVVPVFAESGGAPRHTQNSNLSPSSLGCTNTSFPTLLERMKDDTNGTSTWLKAGFGLLTVRAQSQAMTVSFCPISGLRAWRFFAISSVISNFGYKCTIFFST